MADREDPLISFTFMLEVSGAVSGYFTQISGIGSESETVEHKVVDTKGHEVTIMEPGRIKWTPITLKRGITSNMDVWKWRQLVVDGKMKDARKNATITALDRAYGAVARWNLVNAWPSKVTGPEFNSETGSIAIEEVTIVHEGLIRES